MSNSLHVRQRRSSLSLVKFAAAAATAVLAVGSTVGASPAPKSDPPTVYEVEGLITTKYVDEFCEAATVVADTTDLSASQIAEVLIPDPAEAWPHLSADEHERTGALLRGIVIGCLGGYALQ